MPKLQRSNHQLSEGKHHEQRYQVSTTTDNLAVIGGAFVQMRSAARDVIQALSAGPVDIEAALNAARRIEAMADRLHNAPQLMAGGTECDAAHLLNSDIDNTWPTGMAQKA